MNSQNTNTEGNRRYELVMAGLGGQGVLLATQVLMRAGLEEFEHVSWFPSYATLVRGGDCEGTTVLSDEPIFSPLIYKPKSLIIMSMYALEAFMERVDPGCLFVIDSSLISEIPEFDNVEVVQVPATQQAAELGSSQAANFLMLGVYLQKTDALDLKLVENELTQTMVQDDKESFLPVNLEAIRWGYQFSG
jgi:2-oxoglutarate ferredoxin oxidoreductase subunit gamma